MPRARSCAITRRARWRPTSAPPLARDPQRASTPAAREGRMIASTGKVLAAIAIANSGRDSPGSLYLDTHAPRAAASRPAPRATSAAAAPPIVAFACSLNDPLLNRTAQAGQAAHEASDRSLRLHHAAAQRRRRGHAAVDRRRARPDRAAARAACITCRRPCWRPCSARTPVRAPTPSLIKAYDFTAPTRPAAVLGAAAQASFHRASSSALPCRCCARCCRPRSATRPHGAPRWHTEESHQNGVPPAAAAYACTSPRPARRSREDPNATVDVWVTGGLQFANGAAYSYVVLVGTGSPREPWATSLHAAQVAAPLVDALLTDLAPKPEDKPVAIVRRSKAGVPLALSAAQQENAPVSNANR